MRADAWYGVVLLGLGGSVLGVPVPVGAQDIEVVSQMTGIPLPASYYDEIRRDPSAFQITRGWIGRAGEARAIGAAVEGSMPLLVIQILFSDSPEPHVSVEEVRRVLFEGPADHGTLTDYYREVSGGRLELTGDVLPWVRTEVTLADAVGTNFGLGGDALLGDVLWEALEAADTLVDFGRFDNDGLDGEPNSGDDDGFVDAVAFQFIEVSASCGGPGVWPHRWRISAWHDQPFESRAETPEGDPLRVNDYIIQSTVVCSGATVQTSATIAHELGHVLGLPDFYDSREGLQPEDRRWIVGCWALMAAGAWGCGDPTVRGDEIMPTHLIPWSKERLGWIEVNEAPVGLFQDVSLGPVRTEGQVLRVPLSPTGQPLREYLHVEYRTKAGFDRDIPTSGVMIYRIDEDQPVRRPNADAPLKFRVTVVEADGNQSLLRNWAEGGNRGEPGDAWAWDAEGPDMLSNGSTPSSRRNDGTSSAVMLQDIRIEEGVAKLRVSTEAIPAARLLRTLFGTEGNPLDPGVLEQMDRLGNGNGGLDIGDIRAYFRHSGVR